MAAQAEPDRADAVAQVEQAFQAATAANEEVNQLNSDIEATQAEIAGIDAEIAEVKATYDEQRAVLGSVIAQQHVDSPLGPTASLLASEDPDAFLEGLSAVQAFNSTQAEALDSFAEVADDLAVRQDQLRQLQASLDADKAEADSKKAEVDAAFEDAEAKLASLDAEQRAEFERINPAVEEVMPAAAPSAYSGGAVGFAAAQHGKAYRAGGTGPDAYDCSGLVWAAYASAGISIPRTSGAQYAAGTPISMDQLQPGDLVFYSNVNQHVAMYIGNGQIAEAANPAAGTRVTSLYGRFVKAVRIG
ncbi:MAG: NlpC/P60 family protein [Aeromicrobium sp.]|uniref:C40 family peptidase n=1 Tax=Aeromicrobium sp. TaxID=1871063 RepID=UPI0039E35332